MANHIVKASRPRWITHRRIAVVIPVPSMPQQAAVARPEQHPDYFPVLKALNERRIQGHIVSITSHKPECDEWHEIYAIELGYAHHERRVVFALVRIGG